MSSSHINLLAFYIPSNFLPELCYIPSLALSVGYLYTLLAHLYIIPAHLHIILAHLCTFCTRSLA